MDLLPQRVEAADVLSGRYTLFMTVSGFAVPETRVVGCLVKSRPVQGMPFPFAHVVKAISELQFAMASPLTQVIKDMHWQIVATSPLRSVVRDLKPMFNVLAHQQLNYGLTSFQRLAAMNAFDVIFQSHWENPTRFSAIYGSLPSGPVGPLRSRPIAVSQEAETVVRAAVVMADPKHWAVLGRALSTLRSADPRSLGPWAALVPFTCVLLFLYGQQVPASERPLYVLGVLTLIATMAGNIKPRD
jgi:hypothetical protein